MRQMLPGVLLVVLLLSMSVLPAVAEREVNPTLLDFQIPRPLLYGPKGYELSCVVGNTNPPAWAIPGFIIPPEEYKVVFDPKATCTVCPIGFAVNKVHVLLQTAEACTLTMAVDVEEAEYPTSPDCPEPGVMWCNSGLLNVILPTAGLWDIGLPISCDCLTMDRIYFLSFYIDSYLCDSGNPPDLVTDGGPAVMCANWNNFGTGWYDLFGANPTWPGQLSFSADAECCTGPVPVNHTTWGVIKALYDE